MNNLYLQEYLGKKLNIDKDLRAKIDRSCDLLEKQIDAGAIPAIDAINNCNFEKIYNIADDLKKYNKIYILGVGGSSLGGKTLSSVAVKKNLEFIESIDPETIANFLCKIDLDDSFFVIISKSGETIETICQTLLVKEYLQQNGCMDFSKKFLFITQNLDNSLAKIALSLNCKIENHPADIGGRYSCFSIVGLLPAAICGLNIEEIVKGAKNIVQNFYDDVAIRNSCYNQLYLHNEGFLGNVVMPYFDNLKNFTDWYRQLWAESLGKNGLGTTPINSMGTIDQHSQLQLYIDGPKDKFFTFIINDSAKSDFVIKDIENCPTLFGGINLSKILQIEHETTIESLVQKDLPVRVFKIRNLNEKTIGALMMQMFLETIIIGYANNINPFDQPAVEKRKERAKNLLKGLQSLPVNKLLKTFV